MHAGDLLTFSRGGFFRDANTEIDVATRVDGTGLIRLTHNGSSDGTPEWGPILNVTYRSAQTPDGFNRRSRIELD